MVTHLDTQKLSAITRRASDLGAALGIRTPDPFITSQAEGRGREPALLLNWMTPYGTIRLREAALLYVPAVQQTTATRVSGGKPTRTAGPSRPEERKRRGVRHEALFDRAEMEGLRRRPVVAGCVKWEAA
ncbi:hypothetical protein E1267_09080 [Nonomuraea longispora]|uniref:Uncharacterized protein n=1 Tax=Nonomuraea longispora TaxID=1848320 RepID=A0A4V2XL33_9ACTN|nr:hypothetical protein E1267_09080 [Nonomuraea longispora]